MANKELKKNGKPFINMEEAAEYLGISKSTLYQYTSKGVIPYFKSQGRRNYFRKEDLISFVLNESNRVRSKKEIVAEAQKTLEKSKRGAKGYE